MSFKIVNDLLEFSTQLSIVVGGGFVVLVVVMLNLNLLKFSKVKIMLGL